MIKPTTKYKLKLIIEQRIKQNGSKCNLNDIDVSEITDMSSLFSYSAFNGDISNWDVSKVEIMHYMFCRSNFNGDISRWNVSNLIDMNCMFNYSIFNGDISKWNISKLDIVNPSDIFCKCPIETQKDKQPKFK